MLHWNTKFLATCSGVTKILAKLSGAFVLRINDRETSLVSTHMTLYECDVLVAAIQPYALSSLVDLFVL